MPIKLCAYECMKIILNNSGHRASVHPCIRISNKIFYWLEMWYLKTGLQKVPSALFKRICQMISLDATPMETNKAGDVPKLSLLLLICEPHRIV